MGEKTVCQCECEFVYTSWEHGLGVKYVCSTETTFIVDYDVTVVEPSVRLPVMSSLMKSSKRQPNLQLPGRRTHNIPEGLLDVSGNYTHVLHMTHETVETRFYPFILNLYVLIFELRNSHWSCIFQQSKAK